MEEKIKYSIVTVCYQAADTIEKTMASVMSQTYRNYEYIIIDGLSTDGTVQKIKQRIKNSQLKNDVVFVSERDSGLYNAMNKGIKRCTGDYVLFLNSGDFFYDDHVLEYVADIIGSRKDISDIYYGDVVRMYADHKKIERYPGKNIILKLLLMGRMPCHQSMFVNTQVMRYYGFDESFSITADYNFLMRCRKGKHPMGYLPLIVSCSDAVAGVSSQQENILLMWKQDDRSLKENFPVWYYLLVPIKFVKRRLLG
ncbi:PGL/p-HBAD biosynthesis glycosyltransferase [Lachnospiraceae bacterium]|nr:PGL/p-HBAD biosynthesis glycosyltransferase [Lachnospiraceae bacterium]